MRLFLVSLSLLLLACDDMALQQTGLSTGTERFIKAGLDGERFGAAVDFVNDLNGDSKDEIIAGAPTNSEGGSNAGAVYLILSPLGKTTTLRSADAITILGKAGEEFGSAVLDAGDLDGDDLPEIAIGAPGKNTVYIFLGSHLAKLKGGDRLSSVNADLLITALSSAKPTLKLKKFGAVIERAGDLNRDGALDLAIGAPNSTLSGIAVGAVLLFYGRQSLSVLDQAQDAPQSITAVSAELTLWGESASGLGSSIAVAGDVNGDSFTLSATRGIFGDDLLLGTAGEEAAYLLLGQTGIAGAMALADYPRLKKLTNSEATNFGVSVAGTGDLNADGFSEMAVGYDGGVTIYQGFAEVGVLDNFALNLVSLGSDGFGQTLSGIRDRSLNDPGSFLVGAPNDSSAGSNGGAVYLFEANRLQGSFAASTTLEALSTTGGVFTAHDLAPIGSRSLGSAIRLGGDLNGDGEADALIGAPGYSSTGANSGAVAAEY